MRTPRPGLGSRRHSRSTRGRAAAAVGPMALLPAPMQGHPRSEFGLSLHPGRALPLSPGGCQPSWLGPCPSSAQKSPGSCLPCLSGLISAHSPLPTAHQARVCLRASAQATPLPGAFCPEIHTLSSLGIYLGTPGGLMPHPVSTLTPLSIAQHHLPTGRSGRHCATAITVPCHGSPGGQGLGFLPGSLLHPWHLAQRLAPSRHSAGNC